MTWFKVDDGFWGHPKQTALPAAPVALWVRAGSWSGSQLTDGFVPAHMILMLGAKKRDADQLVTAGLWEDVDGGYQFHDWAKWQPTRDEVEKKRAEDAERKAEWRRKRAAQKAAEAAEAEMSQRDSGRTDAVTPRGVRSSRPDPSRPDQTRPGHSVGVPEVEWSPSGGNATEVDARDGDEPPRCSKHKHTARADVPNCWACGNVRAEWEAARTEAAKPDPWPAWCGTCDERTRLVEVVDRDALARCPSCHPKTRRSAA